MNLPVKILLSLLASAGATAWLSAQPFNVTSSGAVLGSGTLRLKNQDTDSNGLNLTQAASDASQIINYYSGPLILGTNNTERLRIESGGNVGIGTTSPSIAGGYTPKLHLTGAYAAIALEATTPAEKWGIGVDSTGALDIFKSTSNSYAGRLLITNAGNVGVGTVSPSYKLEVNGSVRAASFISNSTTYPDFVFKPGYKLRTLAEVDAAIQREGHLPDIPGEAEVKAHGVDLASQQAKLLQKVEELTLYMIEQNRRLEMQAAGLEELKKENVALREAAGLVRP